MELREVPNPHDDDDEGRGQAILRASGRWIERRLFLKDGKHSILLASFYGVSGSTSCSASRAYNDELIGHIAARVSSMGQIPVFIGTDLNINPIDSNALTSAMFE